ncbi:MAG TPA: homoserine dehydrogenase [Terriglobales bacterium]|nr:homoserine dehydrogenase [Terriglobales bacterium]
MLGYGNVNRTLVRLLKDKSAELKQRQIDYKITGIASRRLGWLADHAGINFGPDGMPVSTKSKSSNVLDWLSASKADILFEATSLNIDNGQPAIDHIRAALEFGAHAITANKGPIVFAHEELSALAKQKGRHFLFESTVMDGVPIFSLWGRTLPAVRLLAIRGVLNSTTNVMLTGMEEGLSFDDSLKQAQQLGIAETDASADIEGWDATVKLTALVNVLMGVRLHPRDVARQGIQNLAAQDVRNARAAGQPYKLVCSVRRTEIGVDAFVRPEQIPFTDPLALVTGTSSIVQFKTDVLPTLTITEENPGVYTTAYGMLADFIRAVAE